MDNDAPTRNRRRGQGRPKLSESGLDREQVFAEALAILEEEGLSSMTMRRLANRLRVSAMALYNHVANKKDLLRGVAEALLDQAAFSDIEDDWSDRIRGCFRELRRVCVAHPGAVRLLEALETPPAKVFRPMQITLSALRDVGISGDDALRAFYLLTNFTLGQASYEVRGPFKGLDPRGHVTGAIVADEDWDFDQAFEFGLTTILAGLRCESGEEKERTSHRR